MYVQRSLSTIEDGCKVAALTTLNIEQSYLHIFPERVSALLIFKVGDINYTAIVGPG